MEQSGTLDLSVVGRGSIFAVFAINKRALPDPQFCFFQTLFVCQSPNFLTNLASRMIEWF